MQEQKDKTEKKDAHRVFVRLIRQKKIDFQVLLTGKQIYMTT